MLQLEERAARRDDQRRRANDDRQRAGWIPVSSLKDRLDRLRSVRTNQAADFIDDLTSYRVGPVYGARNRDRNQQNRRDRKQCVIGKRSTQARDIVLGISCPTVQ